MVIECRGCILQPHEDYDALTTCRLLLRKRFARHCTTTNMLSDNNPNLTADSLIAFMKASQGTGLTSTAGQPRTRSLAERQNLTLLTRFPFICSRLIKCRKHYPNEVKRAYKSTRHLCNYWLFAIYANPGSRNSHFADVRVY